jgi:hypothetical protein
MPVPKREKTTMKLWLAAIALTLMPWVAVAQQVYKCPGPNGQTVFQQAPCAGGKGEAVVVRETNVIDTSADGAGLQGSRLLRDAKVRAAIERRQLMTGMTTAEMQQVMGGAQVVNSDYFNGSVRQQHVYRWADGSTRYVYTQNGIVTGLQERPGIPSANPGRSCNDGSQLADLRFKHGSVTRTPEEKRALRQQIEALERDRCR